MRPRRFTAAKVALVMLGALILQIGAMPELRIAGASGDLLLVLVVAAAVIDGPDRGATWGFGAGLAYDLVLDTPFGLSALTYALVGALVGFAAAAIDRTSGWWPVALAAGAGVVATVVYASIGHLVGVAYPFGHLPPVALVVAAWAAALIQPGIGLVRRLLGHHDADRIAMALGLGSRAAGRLGSRR
jgi:rod shape-determining protein MreD